MPREQIFHTFFKKSFISNFEEIVSLYKNSEMFVFPSYMKGLESVS